MTYCLKTLLFCSIFLSYVQLKVMANPYGEIVKMSGEVRVMRKFKRISPTIHSRLEIGDLVLTKKNGSLDIRLSQKNHIHISGSSRVRLKYKIDNTARKHHHIELDRGTIRSKLDNLKGATFTVKTPAAVVGVRGTDFITSFDPVRPHAFKLTVISGLVDVKLFDVITKEFNKSPNIVKPNQQLRVSQQGKLVGVVKMSSKDMSAVKSRHPISIDPKPEKNQSGGDKGAKSTKSGEGDKNKKESDKSQGKGGDTGDKKGEPSDDDSGDKKGGIKKSIKVKIIDPKNEKDSASKIIQEPDAPLEKSEIFDPNEIDELELTELDQIKAEVEQVVNDTFSDLIESEIKTFINDVQSDIEHKKLNVDFSIEL